MRIFFSWPNQMANLLSFNEGIFWESVRLLHIVLYYIYTYVDDAPHRSNMSIQPASSWWSTFTRNFILLELSLLRSKPIWTLWRGQTLFNVRGILFHDASAADPAAAAAALLVRTGRRVWLFLFLVAGPDFSRSSSFLSRPNRFVPKPNLGYSWIQQKHEISRVRYKVYAL